MRAEIVNRICSAAAIVAAPAACASITLSTCHDADAMADVIMCHDARVSIELFIPRIKASADVITQINISNYLKVDRDVIWVTPEVWEKLQIYSNVEWTIV